jgi:hypothetical protein
MFLARNGRTWIRFALLLDEVFFLEFKILFRDGSHVNNLNMYVMSELATTLRNFFNFFSLG